MKGIIGRKVGMTRLFDEVGNMIPATIIEAGPCVVLQKKAVDTDGYTAVKLAFGEISEKRINKPDRGQFDKTSLPYKKFSKEFDLEGDTLNVGNIVLADTFAIGDRVDITGISKGKGYAGVVKRYGNAEQQHTHGVGPIHRSVGSCGANSDPSRIMKGKKMAGQMGNKQITVVNLDIIRIDAEKNLIAVKGAIPGPKHGIVYIKTSIKK